PTYLALLSAWRPWGVEFIGLDGDAEGLRVEALGALTQRAPKLLYTVANFQNPQGTTLSATRRMKLVEWTRRSGVGLVEDDPYGELRFDGEPARDLFDLDAALAAAVGEAGANVIRVGTFSKVLAPGLRVGWVTASPEIIEKLVQAKQTADLHSCGLSQRI